MTDNNRTTVASRLTEHLYRRYGQRMYCTSHFLLPPPLHDWCFDIVHDTFAEFLRAVREDRLAILCEWRSDQEFTAVEIPCRSYLMTSLEHRCHRKVLRWSRIGLRRIPGQLQGRSEPPETLVLRDELRALVKMAIESLPENWRVVVIQCDIEGRQYREAAEDLGIPLGTLQSRLSRAHEALNRRLDGLCDDRYGDSTGLSDERHTREWAGDRGHS